MATWLFRTRKKLSTSVSAGKYGYQAIQEMFDIFYKCVCWPVWLPGYSGNVLYCLPVCLLARMAAWLFRKKALLVDNLSVKCCVIYIYMVGQAYAGPLSPGIGSNTGP